MKQFKFFASIFLISFSFNSFSQQKYFEPKPVSDADLKLKLCDFDTSAQAMFLFDVANIHIDFDEGVNLGFKIVFDRTYRIKIFKKESSDLANGSFLIHNGDKEKLLKIKAFTYNLDNNGKIEKTEINKQSIFYENISEDVTKVKYTLPKVLEGSVLEVSYSIVSYDLTTLKSWVFNDDIPVKYSEIVYDIPEYFTFKPITSNFPVNSIKSNWLSNQSGSFVSKERGLNRGVTETNFNFSNFSFIVKSELYAVNNIKGFTKELYTLPRGDLNTKIGQELVYIRLPWYTLDRANKSWFSLSTALWDSEKFGKKLSSSPMLKKELLSLKSNFEDSIQFLTFLTETVQKKAKWNNEYSLLIDKDLRQVLTGEQAYSAEVNGLLYQLIKEAGYTVYPGLVSTFGREKPNLFNSSLRGFDHMICLVVSGNELLTLDACSPFSKPGFLPKLDYNGEVLALVPSNPVLVQNNPTKSKEIVILNYALEADETIKGDVSAFYMNAEAETRLKLDKTNPNHQLKSNDIPAVTSEFSFEVSPAKASVSEKYKFTWAGIDKIGEEMRFKPFLFYAQEMNPFLPTERYTPIFLGNPFSETIKVIFNIPSNYEIVSVPKSSSIVLDDLAKFKLVVSSDETSVQMMSELNFNEYYFEVTDYASVKKLMDEMIRKHADEIVIRKKK
jgi:hypothetical protein